MHSVQICCFLNFYFYFLLNERFFKFYSALQFSKASHTISYNPVITFFSLYPYIAPPSFPLLASVFSISVNLLSLCFFFVLITSWLYFLDSTYKWYHTVFVFLCLTYFMKHNALQVHPCCCKWQNFILLYGWVIFHCVYMYMYVIRIHTQHIFFIYSSVDGHLGCFHALEIVNNAA